MAAFLVVYDPSKGKEQEMVGALHRWGATRIFRGAWVLEFDSTADLAPGARRCWRHHYVRDCRDQAEWRPRRDGRRARRPRRAPAAWRPDVPRACEPFTVLSTSAARSREA